MFSLTPLGTPAVWEDVHTQCTSVLRQLIVKLGAISTEEGKDKRTSIETTTTTTPSATGALVSLVLYLSLH